MQSKVQNNSTEDSTKLSIFLVEKSISDPNYVTLPYRHINQHTSDNHTQTPEYISNMFGSVWGVKKLCDVGLSSSFYKKNPEQTKHMFWIVWATRRGFEQLWAWPKQCLGYFIKLILIKKAEQSWTWFRFVQSGSGLFRVSTRMHLNICSGFWKNFLQKPQTCSGHAQDPQRVWHS